MAGSHFSVEVTGQEKVLEAFNQLINQSSDLAPAFTEIGDYLVEAMQERFIKQESPDGEAWEELSPVTLKRKTRKDKILTESGSLADTLNFQIVGNELLVGSNLEYAAMMQFGGTTSPKSMFPNKEIPARPFLGVSDDDEEEILMILREHLTK